ncbi:PEP-CTERM sorting domain-containing protein [bacterium]|nr:MAG: PEP-CTERM sorting domain-containing protein [bacterium]
MGIKTLSIAFALAAVSVASADVVNFSGSLDASSATFNRTTVSGGLSAVGTSVYYDTQLFSVSQSGTYTLTINPGTADSFLALYTVFDPASGATNFVGADDDGLASFGGSKLSINLVSGTTYTFVTTAFANGATFDYDNTISGDGTISLQAVPEPASMAALGLGGLALLRRRKKA